MKKNEKMKRFFRFLKTYDGSDKTFTAKDIVQNTGYAFDSVQTYIRKKLRGKYIEELDNKNLRIISMLDLSEEDFINHMSQVSEGVSTRSTDILITKLMKRSLDAFMVALEVYNRPSLENRVEVFAILLVNAWELLLKSEMRKKFGRDSIFYKDDSTKSLALRNVLKKMLKDTDPIRKNIELIVDLRDQAIHLLIPELQQSISRIFQASVLNFVDCYKKWTGKHPFSGQSVGMLSLILDGPETSLVTIKNCYGKNTANKVAEFLKKVEQSEREINSEKFAIPINYRTVLTKRNDDADFVLTKGSPGESTVFIEVPKDINRLYPHRAKEVINAVNNKLLNENRKPINTYDFIALTSKHKIKGNQKFHYEIEKTKNHLYSEELTDWIFEKIMKNDKWLQEARNSLKQKKKKDLKVSYDKK